MCQLPPALDSGGVRPLTEVHQSHQKVTTMGKCSLTRNYVPTFTWNIWKALKHWKGMKEVSVHGVLWLRPNITLALIPATAPVGFCHRWHT